MDPMQSEDGTMQCEDVLSGDVNRQLNRVLKLSDK